MQVGGGNKKNEQCFGDGNWKRWTIYVIDGNYRFSLIKNFVSSMCKEYVSK
jgi:hypothetical protein